MNESSTTTTQMHVLAALGFGPDSPLMSEPRLFTDMRFLATLLVELEQELESAGARAALFQIGLIRGMRDAYRFLDQSSSPDSVPAAPSAQCPPLAIRLEAYRADAGIEIPGSWPECYEAEARRSRLDSSGEASCALSAGYTSGWLSGILDANVLAVERRCASRGDAGCEFLALEAEAWESRQDSDARQLLAEISFSAAREAALAARESRTAEFAPSGLNRFDTAPLGRRCDVATSLSPGSFDPLDPAVHVWGSVMILPCGDLDRALATIDMLGYDATVSAVRVVVLDLRNAILDQGFEANTLEQIVEHIEAWGAEAILANVASLSEKIVSSLETTHLLVRKDLPEAIAAAFQISEAQKHLL